MIVTPTCRFCQGQLISGGCQTGGGVPYTKYIYHCAKCHSQQMYKYDGAPLNFTFDVHFTGYHYYVSFDPMTMKLYIAKVTATNLGSLGWKNCLDIHLSEFPAWLRPDNISEHRIQTMMVFS
jgi:hypothetical protein